MVIIKVIGNEIKKKVFRITTGSSPKRESNLKKLSEAKSAIG
jgi:hypothetical protein